MTITTYATLQTQVAAFLNREDLTANIPTFIQMAEASMNRRLRHWRMSKQFTATIDARYSAIPVDWLETVRFNIAGDEGSAPLDVLGHSAMAEMRQSYNVAGKPRFYAMVGGDFEFYPTPDTEYTGNLLYQAKIPTLSDSNTTNWLLDYAPDAYLYMALTHSAPFLQEDSRLAVWGGLSADAIGGLNEESERAKHSGSGLKVRMR